MTEGNFVDYVKIHVSSGNGGKGSTHFHREKYIAKGGPDGGDGGRGGHVIVRGDKNLWTLISFKFKRHFKAEHGHHGSKSRSTGADGEDLIIPVPLGTVVLDSESGERIVEITTEEDVIVAAGGMGGRGNWHFKSPTNQTPRYAQPGKEGIERAITLELKVLADVGLVGFPNAGKSTLFNALLNKERSTVSDVPGTTRDKIEENLEANDRKYLITDTAGIPRKKQKDQIDRYSSEISIKSLENTDIALIVVDSLVGLSFEDKRILNSSIENFVTPLLILNKWDLLDTEQKEDINNSIKRDLKQYSWVNVIRVSALSLKNINQIAKNIDLIEEQLNFRISTSELNSYFRELWVKSPPHPFRGKRAKLKFVTQYSTKPPEFGFSLSSRIPKNYLSFIENNIREKFNMSDIAFRIKINA